MIFHTNTFYIVCCDNIECAKFICEDLNNDISSIMNLSLFPFSGAMFNTEIFKYLLSKLPWYSELKYYVDRIKDNKIYDNIDINEITNYIETLKETLCPSDGHMFVDYIYLDSKERKLFAEINY